MTPRLVFIAGPLKDTVCVLGGEEVSVGRDSANRLAVPDSLLSRRHCVVRAEGGAYKVEDLESLNGTFVNGRPVRRHELQHGDRIDVGESRIIFLLEEGEAPPASDPVQISERQVTAHTTLRLRADDALYLRPRESWGHMPPLASMARDLALLVKVSTSINSVRGTEALVGELLGLVFEAVPAERGAILLVDEEGGIVSEFGIDRASRTARSVSVSRTVVGQVLKEGETVLANEVFEAREFAGAESIEAASISSLLCVPLVLYGRTLGVIYLYTSDRAARFGEEHMQIVTVISRIAAVALDNARHFEQLEAENRMLRDASLQGHGMVGESARMRQVYQLIARVAPTDSTVLIRGESGTGKELAAQALHQNSQRRARAFVAINCAALTESLLESELFGHEKGAFTGALAQKKGRVEVADGGTLFLDEVGELAPVLQAKLLRVLQEREFERVGGTRTIRVDVRVIAATNRDLEQAVRAGTFRQDLYYRLNVVSFEMPALRDRREDIPLLANFFATKYAGRFKRRVTGLAPAARDCLVSYDWPGNVRELENAVERAVVLGSTERILPEDLPETILESRPSPEGAGEAGAPSNNYHDAVREAKRQIIQRAVEQAGGRLTDAARLLGVHPNYLHRLLRNLDLKDK
jgi:Nif-specific regulatory protein